MKTADQDRTKTIKVLAFGFLLATLVAMLYMPPAGAAVPSGTAFAWGNDNEGQLGDGAAGPDTNVPGAVKDLTNVRNMDGGDHFTLAATQ